LRKRKGLSVILIFFLMTTGMVIYAPHFLLYATDYQKADAIIILLGPDFKARRKEASELFNKGMADYLIIPAYHKTYGVHTDGSGQYLLPRLTSTKTGQNTVSYPKYYEDTHIELIEAQKTMAHYGLQSAIFVSSPYHMRRIKLIAMTVFDFGANAYYFVPTKYEKAPANVFQLTSTEWRKIRREYSKMVWFLIYHTWNKYIDASSDGRAHS
jgi:hypothetical protein